MAQAVPEGFAQQRDNLATDRRLRDSVAFFSRARCLRHVTGHVFAVGGDARIDIDQIEFNVDHID